jgi:hypothetical protein
LLPVREDASDRAEGEKATNEPRAGSHGARPYVPTRR